MLHGGVFGQEPSVASFRYLLADRNMSMKGWRVRKRRACPPKEPMLEMKEAVINKVVKKQILRQKEQKHYVTYSAAAVGATGSYVDVMGTLQGFDTCESEKAHLKEIRVKGYFATSTNPHAFRIILLRSRKNGTVSATSELFLDGSNNYGAPVSATGATLSKQLTNPTNGDGYIVKSDRTWVVGANSNGIIAFDYTIKLGVNAYISDDGGAVISPKFYLAIYGVENDNTATTGLVAVGTDLTFMEM